MNDARRVATTNLVDLLDRLIGGGVVVTGDVVIALGGVDLLYLDLKLLLAPVDRIVSVLARLEDEESRP